ncbi:MAG: glycosyltransferase family 4 protein [Pseudomonadota bacterium]|nr:glycosyltransferase family 4 protein [Pseudomonadota bacterium]
MSRFPKLTETFVLYEMVAVENLGATVEIYPLLRERQKAAHPEALRLSRRAHFHPFVSLPILRAQWFYLRRDWRAYLKLAWQVLRGTFGSVNFFIGALGVFPKAVRFAYEMERDGVAHVHCHFATHPAVAGLIIHRLTGIPFSFTAHGSDLHVDRTMLADKVRAAAFVVAISEFNKNVIVQECGEAWRDKVQVIHCGVDPEMLNAATARPASGGRLQILCVASFEEVKGHRHLVAACRQLSDQGIDYDCHLVGGGPLRAQVEAQLRQLGLESRFHVHGELTRPEVAELLARADVFVLASVPTAQGKREGIPVVLMEAMASGLPVVSSRLSGIPELVADGRSGILVEPGDSQGLARALAALQADPALRQAMGGAGLDKVRREFNLERNAARLLALFAAAGPGSATRPPADYPALRASHNC